MPVIDSVRKYKLGIMQNLEVRRICKEHNFKKSKMTVLVVDDSPLILSKIKELLEEVEGITALKMCASFTDAIYQFDTFCPKVTLLDINLPDKNGIELLEYIKSKPIKTTVIMLTNQSSDYYRKLCFKMGADHFLDKSKDFDDIPSILSNLS